MTIKVKRYCVICGTPVPHDRRQKDTCCVRCGIEKNMQTVEQLRNKSGPFYERWLARIRGGLSKREINRKRKRQAQEREKVIK